ncbi:hypothetical protein [Aquitalea magnusonii]|uniref:Uncharacterized protein n=1 Tax=Aquitalea magnusonii TaxID=332411 RepID=A0A318J6Q6_9NEIS|nr:hypothetical protein [Aquitalea magnusonii]PXX43666.1 hypothetical protein DFR38_114103 [Aquitalea magnusonii]
MKTSLRLLLLLCSLSITPMAWAYTDEGRLPFVGQPGELPAELALRFVRQQLGQQGQIDYPSFRLIQHSPAPAFDRADITLIRDGLQDDSVKAIRQQLQLRRRNGRWEIHAVREDFSCYRAKPGWTRRLCP